MVVCPPVRQDPCRGRKAYIRGMEVRRLTLAELAMRLRSPTAAEELSPAAGVCCVQVDARGKPAPTRQAANCPVIAVVEGREVPDVVDVRVSSEAEAARVVEAVKRNPFAAAVLVRLLRHNERNNVEDGLFAESLAYSTLQHGSEFRAWLAQWRSRSNPGKPRPPPTGPATLVERTGGQLGITLNRPRKRNAYGAEMRDALCEHLALALDDASISRVVLAGAGTCFSAGGDLDEFGEATDAALAHAARVTRSAGALIHRLGGRVEARLHGACIGAGIELPAFAGRVAARRDAFFQLPEVGMGLIPGAGGTVSILPRIGRHRLAFMALTGARVDTETALAWGLVDAIA